MSPRDRLDLPRLLLIADGFVAGRVGLSAEQVRERVVVLVEAGVRAVQLRDHAADVEAFGNAASSLAAHLRAIAPDVVLFVNGHPVVARALDAILHVGRRGPAIEVARRMARKGALLSCSAHSPSDARRAAEAGADVLLLSPLFRTISHPDATPGEIRLLERTVQALGGVSPPPWLYALGGIAPRHVEPCLQAGAHGVAVLSGLLDAPDPRGTVDAYLASLALDRPLPLHPDRPLHRR